MSYFCLALYLLLISHLYFFFYLSQYRYFIENICKNMKNCYPELYVILPQFLGHLLHSDDLLQFKNFKSNGS